VVVTFRDLSATRVSLGRSARATMLRRSEATMEQGRWPTVVATVDSAMFAGTTPDATRSAKGTEGIGTRIGRSPVTRRRWVCIHWRPAERHAGSPDSEFMIGMLVRTVRGARASVWTTNDGANAIPVERHSQAAPPSQPHTSRRPDSMFRLPDVGAGAGLGMMRGS
jgi:hypothetical protein